MVIIGELNWTVLKRLVCTIAGGYLGYLVAGLIMLIPIYSDALWPLTVTLTILGAIVGHALSWTVSSRKLGFVFIGVAIGYFVSFLLWASGYIPEGIMQVLGITFVLWFSFFGYMIEGAYPKRVHHS